MGRLKAARKRLTAVKGRLSVSSGHDKQRSRDRDREQPWRAWYKTARWQKFRLSILDRDCWICQATGELLVGKYPAPNSPVVDHKIPHRGDERLFWDPGNLWAVSKRYHDSEKAKLENAMHR